MVAFYCECFGLEPVETAQDYAVLESAAWNLSLVVMPAAIAATMPEAVPATRRADTPIKLAFQVESIEAVRPVLTRLGGQLDPAGTQWSFRGQRHCDGVDPEGNVVHVQSRPDVNKLRELD